MILFRTPVMEVNCSNELRKAPSSLIFQFIRYCPKHSLLISYRIYFACVWCKYSKCCKEEKALTYTDWNHLGLTLSRNGDPSVTVGTSGFLWFFLRDVQGCSDAPHVQCIFGWHTLNSISVVAIGTVFQITFFPHRKNHSLVFWLPY